MMFDTFGRALNIREDDWGTPEDWGNSDIQQGENEEGEEHTEGEEHVEGEPLFPKEEIPDLPEGVSFGEGEIPEEEKPVEMRASEAELLYANLLLRTNFEKGFIEEMLEFEPDEESKMVIDELCRKQRELEEIQQQAVPPQSTTTILL